MQQRFDISDWPQSLQEEHLRLYSSLCGSALTAFDSAVSDEEVIDTSLVLSYQVVQRYYDSVELGSGAGEVSDV